MYPEIFLHVLYQIPQQVLCITYVFNLFTDIFLPSKPQKISLGYIIKEPALIQETHLNNRYTHRPDVFPLYLQKRDKILKLRTLATVSLQGALSRDNRRETYSTMYTHYKKKRNKIFPFYERAF